jgi:hypothetical protein
MNGSKENALSAEASEDILESFFMVVPTSRWLLIAAADIEAGFTAKTSSSISSFRSTAASPSWLVISRRGGLGGGDG